MKRFSCWLGLLVPPYLVGQLFGSTLPFTEGLIFTILISGSYGWWFGGRFGDTLFKVTK